MRTIVLDMAAEALLRAERGGGPLRRAAGPGTPSASHAVGSPAPTCGKDSGQEQRAESSQCSGRLPHSGVLVQDVAEEAGRQQARHHAVQQTVAAGGEVGVV
ncbi:hypothetical protein ACIRNI_31940 [Streptomyces sp. NPDC093546]|uniref:hypothetical protein n=1 Tax=Streptomyces sp. NPDC093546 TaxID=3366040 RepID=UPI0037F742A1